MKKIIPLHYLIFTLFYFSCDKDNNTSEPNLAESTQENLLGTWELIGFGNKDSIIFLNREGGIYNDYQYTLKLENDSTYSSKGYASYINGAYTWNESAKSFFVISLFIAGVGISDSAENNREDTYFSAFEKAKKYTLNADTLKVYYNTNDISKGNYLLYKKP